MAKWFEFACRLHPGDSFEYEVDNPFFLKPHHKKRECSSCGTTPTPSTNYSNFTTEDLSATNSTRGDVNLSKSDQFFQNKGNLCVTIFFHLLLLKNRTEICVTKVF